MGRAVFLDRDGIVNWRIVGDYVRCAEEFVLLPDFVDFLRGIKALGFLSILVTNQQGIGKGLVSPDAVAALHEQLQQHLQRTLGSGVDDIFVCPDLEGSNSPYRKPEPGMLLEAIRKWHLHPAQCWMVGDSASDILAGYRAGVRTVLVGAHPPVPYAEFHVRNLWEALEVIAQHSAPELSRSTS
ncbi:MAG: HAD-IIIA family hydrolase [Chlorobiota bacterium]|jgi:D-glycero-D-manno-heptose 1,7-bisphosphate phosphatase|nr:HAD-IIIA family hydrolase [Chlorobiota bacterium]